MSLGSQEADAIRSTVRRNAIWAAGAAVIMLYFGIGTSIPHGTVAPQTQGWFLFLYALKVGGAALILSALLSLVGIPLALMYDAVASVAIGLALAVSGVLIYRDSSYQALFNLAFGALFVHCGYRNWREFNLVSPADVWDAPDTEEDDDSVPPADGPSAD